MSVPLDVWDMFVAAYAPAFTQPSFALFQELLNAWVLCPGRHTVTRMIRMLDPAARREHDAYHRFLRVGAWSMFLLWRLLAQARVAGLVGPLEALALDVDDTLFHKTGRKVEGAGSFRDAVRSKKKRVVYALGLNLVVMTLRIKAPWGGEPLGLPINVRVYKKGGPSHLDLAVEMLREVAGWFPDRKIQLCADGAYASLASRMLPHSHLTSRMRRDAALYNMPPKRKKKGRGRPRKKGERLPTPEEIARRVTKWMSAPIDFRGRLKERLIYARPVLWYKACPARPVLLVIVRDPAGIGFDFGSLSFRNSWMTMPCV
ncbi:MAG: transposase [Elusimicrobia bacterium]|nr:transposase [Elusimicrobiota bacterium]